MKQLNKLRTTALWSGVVTARDAKHRRVLNLFFSAVYTYEEAAEAAARLFVVADEEDLSVRMLLARALKDSRGTDEGWATLDTDVVSPDFMERLVPTVFDLFSEEDLCRLASSQWSSSSDVVDTVLRATDIGMHDTFAV